MPRINEIQFLREKVQVARATGDEEYAGDLERRLARVRIEVEMAADPPPAIFRGHSGRA